MRMSDLSTKTQASFDTLLQQIQQARQTVLAQANSALIDLYWQVGKTISHKVQTEAWGKGVVRELAQYIAHHAPDIRGFSDKNLWRMKQFYETYASDGQLAARLRALPWTHNTLIFSRCKSAEERQFYLEQAIQGQYTSRELDRQINAANFERSVLVQPKLSAVLRELHPSLSRTFKDSYVLEFLGLPEAHSESDLQKALTHHMKAFILELGGDFIFIGEQYRLQVDRKSVV